MNAGPTLSLGMIGNDVRRIQRIFVAAKVLSETNLNGKFDATTQSVIKDFQQSKGLPQTGIVNQATWQALPSDVKVKILMRGMKNARVKAMQQTLAIDNYYSGAIDGDFGPITEQAVYAYQQDKGIITDGIVGDQTWFVPIGAAGATLASLSGIHSTL
jgi:peptidoglycan hydrolase-like protein with peptidoglycan-binding domain